MQYKLYLPPFPHRWGPIFDTCTPVGWLLIKADCYCIHNGYGVSCIISTKCSAVCIYRIQYKMCPPMWMCGGNNYNYQIRQQFSLPALAGDINQDPPRSVPMPSVYIQCQKLRNKLSVQLVVVCHLQPSSSLFQVIRV